MHSKRSIARVVGRSVLLGCVGIVGVGCSGAPAEDDVVDSVVAVATPAAVPTPDRARGLASFDTVYEVLMHPRCLNCHPAGDRPLQSDASVPHVMNVQRGPDDRGRAGMRCVTCHGTENLSAPHLPPGVSTEWHLAPRSMVFEGLSPHELAGMLLDPARSHMTIDELIDHVSHDPLVMWGWNPGPGRTAVPVPHAEFVGAFRTWIESGAPVPEKGAGP